MKAAIYTRVSSTEQVEEGYSLEAQIQKLTAYCNAKDWIIYKSYIDPGYTGANINRPAMQQLIQDVPKHNFDVIVVYKLDRFSRSQKDCLTLLEDVLLPNNCDFVSINENFDTSTPYGRAMIGILSVFAQLERETIKERTVMGRIERAKTGLYSGNCNIPIGYDYVDGKLVINDYEAMQIREIYDLYINGIPFFAICDRMTEKGYTTKYGSWKHVNTVKRVLTSKLYYGDLKYKGNFYKGQHEPIIDKDTYDKAQAVRKLRSETATGHRKTPFMSTHLLTGLLWCGECGARMHAKTLTHKGIPQYICYSKSRTNCRYIVDTNCNSKSISCIEAEKYVLDCIRNLNFESILTIQQSKNDNVNPQTEIDLLEKQIIENEKKISKLMDLYLSNAISKEQISSRLSDLEKNKLSLLNTIEQYKKRKPKREPEDILDEIKMLDEIIKSENLQEKKSFLSSLIDSIIISDEITINWNFT